MALREPKLLHDSAVALQKTKQTPCTKRTRSCILRPATRPRWSEFCGLHPRRFCLRPHIPTAQRRPAHSSCVVTESWREECLSPNCQVQLVGCCTCSSQPKHRVAGVRGRSSGCCWPSACGSLSMQGFGASGVNAPTGAPSKGFPARPRGSSKNLTSAPTFNPVTSGRFLPSFVSRGPDRRVGSRPSASVVCTRLLVAVDGAAGAESARLSVSGSG